MPQMPVAWGAVAANAPIMHITDAITRPSAARFRERRQRQGHYRGYRLKRRRQPQTSSPLGERIEVRGAGRLPCSCRRDSGPSETPPHHPIAPRWAPSSPRGERNWCVDRRIRLPFPRRPQELTARRYVPICHAVAAFVVYEWRLISAYHFEVSMIGAIARRFFGSANDRFVKSLQPLVDAINRAEPALAAMSDDELRGQTAALQARIAAGETLDDILVDAFATVRETAKRVLGQRHFDVQLLGGIVLHRGMIAEMKTGEGKTLVATLPVYLNALSGNGVHVVTVNDYLARRDSEWMGQIYRFLGLTVGCIVHDLDDMQRQQAYLADVTYGTNNELGFDYLRDNMKFRLEDMVHRPFHYAIVDEVDSILIDEARTPLIISGPTEDNSELYIRVDKLIPALEGGDYEKDEKQH